MQKILSALGGRVERRQLRIEITHGTCSIADCTGNVRPSYRYKCEPRAPHPHPQVRADVDCADSLAIWACDQDWDLTATIVNGTRERGMIKGEGRILWAGP